MCVSVLCTQVNMMFVMLLWVCIHTGQAETFAWPRWESNPRPLGYLEYIDIEGTRLSSEIAQTRTDLTS